MFVIMAVATDTRAVGAAAAIAIGATVGPRRTLRRPRHRRVHEPRPLFGPALVANQWTEFWIYIVGPIAGALLGGLAYQVIRGGATLEPGPDAS